MHIFLMPWFLIIISLIDNSFRYVMLVWRFFSLYHTNAYCLQVYHVGSWGYWLAWKGRVSKVTKKRRLVSTNSILGLPRLWILLYSFMFLDFYLTWPKTIVLVTSLIFCETYVRRFDDIYSTLCFRKKYLIWCIIKYMQWMMLKGLYKISKRWSMSCFDRRIPYFLWSTCLS